MNRHVTIKQVATRAGVSVGTVSRCLNGFPNISAENLDRVKAAVDELGYRQCQSARQLVARRTGSAVRTGNLGVYFPSMISGWASHPLFLSYLQGVESACAEHGLHPLIEFGDEGGERHPPRFLQDRKVDGMLIKDAAGAAEWLEQHAGRLPVVGMGTADPGLSIPQVAPDNRAAGWQVAEYLWSLGHRRIAFACHSPVSNYMFLHRRQGIEEFLQTKGGLIPELLLPLVTADARGKANAPESAPPDMRPLVERLCALPSGRRPTAVVCANDWMATGLYKALSEMGVLPGRDIGVVGFDNLVELCCSLTPPLTSYVVPLTRTAYVATRLLIDQIASPKEYASRSVQLVSGELVERQSVCPLPEEKQT